MGDTSDQCLTIDGQYFYFVLSLDRHGLIKVRSQRFVKFKQFGVGSLPGSYAPPSLLHNYFSL